MENGRGAAVFIIIIYRHSRLPTSAVACLFVSPGRMPNTIFVTAVGILEMFIVKQLQFTCLHGSRGGGGGERQWTIVHHLW